MFSMQDLTDVLLEVQPVIRQRYQRRLATIAQRFDTDDLCQATAMRAVRGLPGCKAATREELKRWVIVISANCVRSALKSHKGTEKRAISSQMNLVTDSGDNMDLPSRDRDAWADKVVKADCQHMLGCLDRLPKQRQRILEMRYLQGLGHEVIAKQLGISVSASRVSLSQALDQLKSEMGQYSLPNFFDGE